MDAVRRRLRLMRRDGLTAKPSPSSTLPQPPPPQPMHSYDRESAKRPRESAKPAAFSSRMSGTVQSATMPFKRLLERVKFRLTTTKTQQARKKQAARTAPSVAELQRRLALRVDSLKFCVLREPTEKHRGWVVERRFLLDEAQFVWIVTDVTSAQVWSMDGIRPGDVLESIGGVLLCGIVDDADVEELLRTSESGSLLRFRVRSQFDRCRIERSVVHVEGGSLGISIVADGPDAIPVVLDVPKATASRSKNAKDVRIGDVMVEVNGKSVLGWGIPAVMAMVKSCGRQLTITFQRWSHDHCGARCRHGAHVGRQRNPQMASRRIVGKWFMRPSGSEFHDDSADEDEDPEVVLVWRSGVLGMTMVQDGDAMMPLVNRLTGKGTTPGIHKLRHGYHLASINGVATHKRSFRDVMRDLERLPKPMWLVFLPPDHRVSSYTTGSRPSRSGASRSRPGTARWSSSSSLLSEYETRQSTAEDSSGSWR